MRRINSTDGMYHNYEPTNGIAGTVVTAEALNSLQEEIIAVITAAGVELDEESTTQLRDAILALTGGGSLPWGAITDKPATYPPSVHNHAISDIVGFQPVYDAPAETTPASSYPNRLPSMGTVAWPTGTGTTLTVPRIASSRVVQFLVPASGGTSVPEMYFRASHDSLGGGGWTGFMRFWHTGNFIPASKLDVTAYTWSTLPGKPSTFVPAPHTQAISTINGLQGELDARPVQTTITSQINAAVSGLINGAPGALDQLNELAAALGNDANFAATVTNALAGKQPSIPSSTSIDADALASSYSPAGVATIGSAGAGSWPYGAGTVLTINSINDIRTAQIIFGVYGGSQIPEASFRTYHTSGGGGGWTAPVRLWHAGNLNPDIFAPREDPTFTGTVSLDKLAATGAITGANLSGVNTGDQDLSGLAPKASPTFTGTVSLATLAATGAITSASVRATGTIMAVGGFQIG